MVKTHERFLKEVEIKNDKVIVLGKYSKAHNRIKVKCKRCAYEWEPKALSVLSGRGCPKCCHIIGADNNKGKTGRKSHNTFVKELLKVNQNIKVLSLYTTNHEYIKCECKICNNVWEARAYSLLQGHGCPRCAKSGTSFMEQFIRLCFVNALSENDVISRDRKTIGMELDILIPKYKIAIEPGNWCLHHKYIKRDNRKRELCQKKGIRLITVYDKYPINTPKPFKENCLVFENDYNKANHCKIRELVLKLFEIVNLRCDFSEDVWLKIEEKAYLNAKARTHEDFLGEMKKIHPTIQVLEEYQNSNKRIMVRCNICEFEWNACPANLISGDGCRRCGTKKAHEKFIKNQRAVIEELKVKNPTIELIGKYKGRHHKTKTKCKICGYIWEPYVSSLLNGSSHMYAKTMHKKLNK